MRNSIIVLSLCASMLAISVAASAQAQSSAFSDNVVKIGVLTDKSGPYADLAGEGSVTAAKMAIDEFGGKIGSVPIELVSADHQDKADIGSSIAREWFDAQKVDAIADISNSAIGFAVVGLADERKKIVLNTSGSPDFSGKRCTSTSFQWVYNSYTNGYGLAKYLTKGPDDSWFLLTVDYAYGQSFSSDIKKAVADLNGVVKGEVKHPLNTNDFSSFLLQAQASGAKYVAMVNAGADMANSLKQAVEFGLTSTQHVIAPNVFLTDIDSIGLDSMAGLQSMTAFYWDRDQQSREWSEKFYKLHGAMPTMTQAGVYSAVRHYLESIQAASTDDGPAVAAKMHELPVDDAFAKGDVRPDGQFEHDMYLVEVKKPDESTKRWDYQKIVATVPGRDAFRPLSQSECPLVGK